MTRTTCLSLEGLPTFESSPIFCCIDSDIEDALAGLPDTSARIRVASRFLQRFGESAHFLTVPEEELLVMWGGYLRGALMEYAGVEGAFTADVRRLGLSAAYVPIMGTRNALLILLRELRNIHVHVVQRRFDSCERDAVMRIDGEEHRTRHEIITIPSSDLRQLLEPRIAKHYSPRELEQAVEWLDWAQSQWGIRDVVLAALNIYACALSESMAKSVSNRASR